MSAVRALTCDNKTDRRGAGNASTVLTHLSDYGGRGLGVSLPIEESWRPVLGYEGRYEVSNHGRVRSLTRGGILKARPNDGGYLQIALYADGVSVSRRVHVLVCEAWHGPRPEGQVCRHLDDDKLNNSPDNLAWGTQSDNLMDTVLNGNHYIASRDACASDHPYTAANTRWATTPETGRPFRDCRSCARDRDDAWRAKRRKGRVAPPTYEVSFTKTGKPVTHGRELSYTKHRCRCADCREAHRLHGAAKRAAKRAAA